MQDAKDLSAGAVILRDLALFDSAAVYYERIIEPRILEEVTGLIFGWAATVGWGHGAESDDFGGLWIAPPTWQTGIATAGVANGGWRAWFELTHHPDSYDDAAVPSYGLTDLCGIGQAQYGLMLVIDQSSFKDWSTYVKRSTVHDIGRQLRDHGWMSLGKGAFFLPVKLPAERLATAWESEDWSDVLKPLKQALDRVNADFRLFDALLRGAGDESRGLVANDGPTTISD
jgi:hypothetical protein